MTLEAGLDPSSVTVGTKSSPSPNREDMEGVTDHGYVDTASIVPNSEHGILSAPSVTWATENYVRRVPLRDTASQDASQQDNASDVADGTDSEWATASRIPSEVDRGFSTLLIEDALRHAQGLPSKNPTTLGELIERITKATSPPADGGIQGGMASIGHRESSPIVTTIPLVPSPPHQSNQLGNYAGPFPIDLLPTMLPLFFHFVGHYLPCIHPATFSTRPISYFVNNAFLMCTIFAITWSYHDSAHPDKSSLYPHFTSEYYLARAKEMILDVLDRPCIEHVWGLLFYVLGISTRTNSQNGEPYLGAAIGMARSLGLHEDNSNENQEYGSPGWVQAEERRRTYISVWKFDMFWAAGLQVPWLMEKYPAEKLRLAVSDRIWMPSVFIDKPPRYRAVVGKIGALESSGMPEAYGLVWYDAVVGSRSGPRDVAWKELYRLRETHSDLFPGMPPLPSGPTVFLDNGLIATIRGPLKQMETNEQYPLANITPTRQYLYDYAGLSISGRLVWHVMVGASLQKAQNDEERLKNALEGIELVQV
ncbi:hypothetical protein HDU93_002005 [Gonapodya sp. JEL0774]|nr:hypothetical protein HDU93_002005 [Gonapodya sp. JEL0774]